PRGFRSRNQFTARSRSWRTFWNVVWASEEFAAMPKGIRRACHGHLQGIDGHLWASIAICICDWLLAIGDWLKSNSKKRTRNPDSVPGSIPTRSRIRWFLIPGFVGIKSGSRRVSPLDFGIEEKKFCFNL